MSKSATIEALTKCLASHRTYGNEGDFYERMAADIEEAIYKGEIPGIAKQSHDGTTCWMCSVCRKTRDGRGCLVCAERDRDTAVALLAKERAAGDKTLRMLDRTRSLLAKCRDFIKESEHAFGCPAYDEEDEPCECGLSELPGEVRSLLETAPPTSTTPDAKEMK